MQEALKLTCLTYETKLPFGPYPVNSPHPAQLELTTLPDICRVHRESELEVHMPLFAIWSRITSRACTSDMLGAPQDVIDPRVVCLSFDIPQAGGLPDFRFCRCYELFGGPELQSVLLMGEALSRIARSVCPSSAQNTPFNGFFSKGILILPNSISSF